jgi:hypothetical protein
MELNFGILMQGVRWKEGFKLSILHDLAQSYQPNTHAWK